MEEPSQANDFRASYAEARQLFQEMSNENQWAGESHAIAGKGPNDEELTIDIATSSEWQPKTLIISSGVHGVEGYFGSAVQVAILRAVADSRLKIPSDCRIVMLHALNPYGFAWDRRADQDNIDLNRNCLIIPPDAYAGSPPGYAEVDPLINPTTPPGLFDFFNWKLSRLAKKMGEQKIKTAIASGQYENPKGLFFGGKGASGSLKVMRNALQNWIPDNSTCAGLLDLHSGLGEFGEYNLLAASTRKVLEQNPLAQKFDPAKIRCLESGEGEYSARGALTTWMQKFQFAPQFFAFTVEFGTFAGERVLAALRAENRCHWLEKPGSPTTHAVKAEMREVFCPSAPMWRKGVIADTLALVQQSLEILTNSAAWTETKKKTGK